MVLIYTTTASSCNPVKDINGSTLYAKTQLEHEYTWNLQICFTTESVCLGQVAAIQYGALLLHGRLHHTFSEVHGSPVPHTNPWPKQHSCLYPVNHLGNTCEASGPTQSEVYQGRLVGTGPPGQAGGDTLFVDNLVTVMKPTKSLICFLLSLCAGNSKMPVKN